MGGALTPKDWSPCKKGDIATQTHTGRIPCDDGDRDQSDAFTSQASPATTEAGREAWNKFSLTVSEGTNSPEL